MAVELRAAATELEDYDGNYTWPSPAGDVSLQNLFEILNTIVPFAVPEPPGAGQGRPRVPWRDAGRGFARSVKLALTEVGYDGRLEVTDSESVTTVIAAAAISWAYEQKVSLQGSSAQCVTGIERKQ